MAHDDENERERPPMDFVKLVLILFAVMVILVVVLAILGPEDGLLDFDYEGF